jgi:hypothetical protein
MAGVGFASATPALPLGLGGGAFALGAALGLDRALADGEDEAAAEALASGAALADGNAAVWFGAGI